MTEIKKRKHLSNEERAKWEAFQDRVSDYGAYLGGAFEAGGWMGAYLQSGVVKGKRYTYGRLGISLNDTDVETIRAFQSIMGGKIYEEKGDNSWTLNLPLKRIPFIASAIENYAPTRR